MTEYLQQDGGGDDKETDDNGPLGPIGKCVARRERRLDRDRERYDRLLARQGRALRTDADYERWQAEQNELLTLEERLGVSGRDPYLDAAAEEVFDPQDAVPDWLRRQWDAKTAAGSAALGLTSPELQAGAILFDPTAEAAA